MQKLQIIFIYGICIYLFVMFCITIRSLNLTSSLLKQYEEQLSVNDILITLKTSSKYHRTRLKYIHQTWYQHAKSQVIFFRSFFNLTLF